MIGSRSRHALLRPSIAIPFILVALIWGSTWFVIKDQLAMVPPSWSVAYRFVIATIAMFALAKLSGGAKLSGRGFTMTFSGHVMAAVIGLSQFFLNYNFLYRAELHLTSGIVAVLYGLLVLPNAVFGLMFLGHAITRRLVVGSLIGLAGITLLLIHEANVSPPEGAVGLGIVFAVIGILCASAANVFQASDVAQRRPLLVLLAWAMLWGTLADVIFAWSIAGPPIFPADLRYWGGVSYLAIVGSVVTFPLYFGLIRDLGPARAAYNGVLVPVAAMVLSTLFEGYNWSILAVIGGALALIGMVIALRGRDAPQPLRQLSSRQSSFRPLR